jgi:hypothetical protein
VSAIQSIFVRAKHWQIFLLFAICWCAVIGAMLRSILLAPADPFGKLLLSFAAMEAFAVAFAAWLWSIGEMLDSVVPSPLNIRISLFRLAVTFPPLYMPVFAAFFVGMNAHLSVGLIVASYAVVFLLNSLALFCQVYSWYFVSKCLALAERSRHVTFSDYQGYVLGLWVFPVGVWFIQPRINRLYPRRFTEDKPV